MKIAASLEVKLTRGEWIGNRYKTNSFEAWSHVIKGFSLLNQGTVEDLLKSRKHFEQAVNLDSDYAYAWEGRGNCLAQLDRPADAVSAYRRALILDDERLWAHNNLGHLLGSVFQDYAEALKRFDQEPG